MKYRYLPATIMLTAGAITCFICIYNGYETLYSLKVLLVVLIMFLIIGSLTRRAFIKIIELGEKEEENKKAAESAEGEEGEKEMENAASEEGGRNT